MKKVLLFTILSLLLFSSLIAGATAWEIIIKGEGENPTVKTKADEKVEKALEDSPFFGGLAYFVFGVKRFDNNKLKADYGLTSILIIFFLIWLILFLTFSDIIMLFSPFSKWTSWFVGFAITVIAANLFIVQTVAIWAINITAIFGTISVFIGIAMAFVAFLALSFGTAGLQKWAISRKMGMEAHRGRAEISEGAVALRQVGRDTINEATESKRAWWIILAIIIGAAVLLTILDMVGVF